MTAVTRIAACAALVACALVGALSAPQPAAAKTVPCWTKLLNDWYDGRIDRTYPVKCYRDALKHLPDDVAVYSSARTDIQRALANAVRNRNGTQPIENVPVPPSTAPTTTSGDGSSNGQNDATGGRDNGDDGPVGSALGSASDSADSIPVPLIILGALALLLIAAGVAGVLVKRYQARHPGTPGA